MSRNALYEGWIGKIVAEIETGVCPEDIIAHIGKHATTDLAAYAAHPEPDWQRWSAGMHNLLAIFDGLYRSTPTTESKLSRLKSKYESDPATYTAPPECADQ